MLNSACLVAALAVTVYCSVAQSYDENAVEMSNYYEQSKIENLNRYMNTDCPVRVDGRHPHDILKDIEDKYQTDSWSLDDIDKLDESMVLDLLVKHGRALRTQYEEKVKKTAVPAGLNLGGHCKINVHDTPHQWLKESIIFFHRMKLRNETNFSIVSVRNQLEKMLLYIALNLNDLHLEGSYERCKVRNDTDIINLYYQPSFGVAEILLQDVKYLVQGRYTTIGNKLTLEMIDSNIYFENALLVLNSKDGQSIVEQKLGEDTLEEFMQRMKVDLDEWLKDFFNDFLNYSDEPIPKVLVNPRKSLSLNNLADAFIEKLSARQRARQEETPQKLPLYTLHSIVGTRVDLTQGAVIGLDSMHRRSAATAVTYINEETTVRGFDVDVGFSDLSLVYGASLTLPSSGSSKGNRIILTANQLTARLEVLFDKDPKKVKVSFKFLRQIKPELLTLDGPISRDIANFKHLLELHITTLMISTLHDSVNNLADLISCGPGAEEDDNIEDQTEGNIESNDKDNFGGDDGNLHDENEDINENAEVHDNEDIIDNAEDHENAADDGDFNGIGDKDEEDHADDNKQDVASTDSEIDVQAAEPEV